MIRSFVEEHMTISNHRCDQWRTKKERGTEFDILNIVVTGLLTK